MEVESGIELEFLHRVVAKEIQSEDPFDEVNFCIAFTTELFPFDPGVIYV